MLAVVVNAAKDIEAQLSRSFGTVAETADNCGAQEFLVSESKAKTRSTRGQYNCGISFFWLFIFHSPAPGPGQGQPRLGFRGCVGTRGSRSS